MSEQTLNFTYRKALSADIDRVAELFLLACLEDEKGPRMCGWRHDIYPTRETAELGLRSNDLYVQQLPDGTLSAAARINGEQGEGYEGIDWQIPAEPEQVAVMHTLAVDPELRGRGCATDFLRFYEAEALRLNRPVLRIDTAECNTKARRLYKQLGYREAGKIPFSYSGFYELYPIALEKQSESRSDEAVNLCVRSSSTTAR